MLGEPDIAGCSHRSDSYLRGGGGGGGGGGCGGTPLFIDHHYISFFFLRVKVGLDCEIILTAKFSQSMVYTTCLEFLQGLDV